MKKNLKVLFLAVFVAAASCSFTTKEFDDPDKDKILLDLITYVLQKGHYESKDIDDSFSEGVYTDFINGLDPLKRYFLASDIEEFSVYKREIDDQIKNKELTFFNSVHSRFLKRMDEVKVIYIELLDTPFDYSQKESIHVDYDNLGYAKSKKEVRERWRIQLKFSTISNYYDLIEEEKTKSETEEGYVTKTHKELEEKSRLSSKASLQEYFEFTNDLARKDYFAVFFEYHSRRI